MSLILKKYLLLKIFLIEKENRKNKKNLKKNSLLKMSLRLKLDALFKETIFMQKEPSFIGEIIEAQKKNRILIKVNQDGKFIVKKGKKLTNIKLKPGTRVAIKTNSYVAHEILPALADPIVSLMKVENVPLSNYKMIGGLDAQINQIKETVEIPLKFPLIFERLGVTQPKGVLLYGPPGTGKTLLARAVAHHSACTFIRMSSSELVQKYIGEGSRMVREIFLLAKENSPSIIFMDEVDSVGSSRHNSENAGGDSEVQRTMLELLNQLDGFETQQNIKILMATNRLDVLDPALIRPGRIDRKIRVPYPNNESRLAILKIHLRKIKTNPGIDLWKISKNLRGASGAEIKAVVTEAGMFAIRGSRMTISQEDFNQGICKIIKKGFVFRSSIRSLFIH